MAVGDIVPFGQRSKLHTLITYLLGAGTVRGAVTDVAHTYPQIAMSVGRATRGGHRLRLPRPQRVGCLFTTLAGETALSR